MFKYTLLLLSALVSAALACEPECRHGLAHAFAGFYGPVVELAVGDLQNTFSNTLFNLTIPTQISATVPDDVLRTGVTNGLSDTLQLFVNEATGKPLEDGIFSVMFSEEKPFKGDCNHPARLTRKMPPTGESWYREECVKMDYICGNPPSICHFLDDVKDRIVRRIRTQLEGYATFDNGFLVRNVVQTVKQSTRGVMEKYGAGSMVNDPNVTSFINGLISNAVRSLDMWAALDVKQLCNRAHETEACHGWDEQIIPEILKWP
ncbi:hypothetical protein BDB00DRAFT_822069 [Zychaea mexicana]|uniref:uncharacterized protein n=1 Tax=Zychaea mexicana TaxID=64656 RepID=UPI0022FEA866|nr:uncharacterized protein BDB00DRAFT_822069 [Zychaea mexicana]KAI9493670.1 hypothetical protein BDB00DRAFT_822069 [Zychaea mexicana]